jgi:hypothetical protein
VNVGPRGVVGTVGLPGTGLSYRTKLAGVGSQRRPEQTATLPGNLSFSFGVGDELVLRGGGRQLSPEQVVQARRQLGPQIRAALEMRAAALNEELEILANRHTGTPAPAPRLNEGQVPPPPPPPAFDEPGLSSAERARRAGDLEIHDTLMRRWIADTGAPSVDHLTQQLEDRLVQLVWPRETLVDLDISPDGLEARLDIDLPEIEDLPDVEARANARDLRIDLKPLSRAARRRLYSTYVHGTLLRLAGEVFAEPSWIRRITLSGFSQRVNGVLVTDVYMLSVQIERDDWEGLDFACLATCAPEALMGQFRPRRSLAADGNLGSIIPFD